MQHFTDFYDAYMFLKYNPMVWISNKDVFNYFNECLNIEIIKDGSMDANNKNNYHFEMTLSSIHWNEEKKIAEIIPTLDDPIVGTTYEDAIIKLANNIYNKSKSV